MSKAIVCALASFAVVACTTTTPTPPTTVPPTIGEPNAPPGSVAAGRDADACLTLEPQSAACLYSKGVALGLEARAHPTRAGDLLREMLDDLQRAEAADAGYDSAGPARVSALVLIRAPGWPLGPGDPDAGLAAARRAVTLRPDYPPNLLALAEAFAKQGSPADARDAYARARDAALAFPPGADRDDWLREADRGLHRSP